MVRISPPVKPNSGMFEIYRKKYQTYESVCGALDHVWGRFEV
jgi:hypothetical protein